MADFMTRAVVLGNGVSRLDFDLEAIKSKYKVFGCNALFRDFTPDVLVATDPGISREIENSEYPADNVFYTRKPTHENSRLIPKNYGYSSGPVAVTLAAEEGFDIIYMVGFDLAAIKGRFNNVYAGTEHYKAVGADPTYYGNWVDQIFRISREYGEKTFARVGDDLHLPKEWERRHNITAVSSAKFKEIIS